MESHLKSVLILGGSSFMGLQLLEELAKTDHVKVYMLN